MTTEEILKIFIEQHKICSPLDPEADPFEILSMDSTIDEWRNANDLLAWRPLSRFLNEEFDMKNSEEEWSAVLTPSDSKTLKDVCTFICDNTNYKDVQPIKILGQECLSAAIFLTLKKYLQRRNVDVTDLKPSSSIIPYLEKYFSPMLELSLIHI